MSNASPASAAVPFLFFGGFIGLLYYLRWREVAAARDGLRAAGATDAHIRAVMFSGQVAEGTVRGRKVRFEVEQGGKNSPSYTTVAIPAPPGIAFEMHLSEQTPRALRLVEQGLEIDVNVGDPSFDDRVIVEAAPSRMAVAVLDASLRERILAQMPCTVSVAGGTILLRKRGKLTSIPVVQELVDLVSTVDAMISAVALELAAQQPGMAAQDYRGGYGEAGAALRDAGAERELAHLREVRARQAARQRRFQLLVLGAIGLYVGGTILYLQSRDRGSRSSNASHATGGSTSHPPTPHPPTPGAAPPASTVVHAPVSSPHPKLSPGELTPDAFCEAVAGINGASRREWCSKAEQQRPVTAHLLQESDARVTSCKASLASSIGGGLVKFDPKAARACVEATYAAFAPSDLDAEGRLAAAQAAACKPVLTGSVEQGAACTGDLECKAGLSCRGTQRATRCEPPASGGDACGIAIDLLQPSADIGPYQPYLGETHLHDGCAEGFSCNILLNRCDPLGKKGDKCGLLDPCGPKLMCRFAVCTDERGGEEGEPCTSDTSGNDCRAGLACSAKTHTCGPRTLFVGLCQ